MKLKKRNIIVCLALMGSIMITKNGWVSDTYAEIKNLLQPNDTEINSFKGGVDIGITEDFNKTNALKWDGNAFTKEVKVTNNSATPNIVRVSIVSMWEYQGQPWGGDINAVVLETNTVANTSEPGWMDGGDGYFYYNRVLNPKTSIDIPVIKSVSIDFDKIPDDQEEVYKNKDLIVNVKAESVEATKINDTEYAHTKSWTQINEGKTNSSVVTMLENLCK